MTRVAIYADGVAAPGRVRQSMAIAGALARLRPRPAVLLLSSAPVAPGLPRPEGCDLIQLPGPVRWGHERYAVLDPVGSPPRRPRSLRADVIVAALTSFSPDLLLVDRHPRGVRRELEAALTALAGATRCVLTLRDVLDGPEEAGRQWSVERGGDALAEWYDAVWVLGDRRVHDTTAALAMPPRLRAATTFTGYLAPRSASMPHTATGHLVGLVGGGPDSCQVAESFIAAADLHGQRSELVLGRDLPLSNDARLRATAYGISNLVVHDAGADLGALLHRAGAVVSTGGYGTTCAVLRGRRPTLMVPVVGAGHEQLVRARALADHGLVSVLPPDELSPEALASWARTTLSEPPPASGGPAGKVALDGLRTVSALAARMVSQRVPVGRAV